MEMKFKQELNTNQMETQERLIEFLGTTINHDKLLNSIKETNEIIQNHDFFDGILKKADTAPARQRRLQRFYDIIALSLYQGTPREKIINTLDKMKDKEIYATSYLRRAVNDPLVESYWTRIAKKDAELDDLASGLILELY